MNRYNARVGESYSLITITVIPVTVVYFYSDMALTKGLFLDGFNGNGKGNFVTDVRRVLSHIEVCTLNDCGCVRTASVLFQHRVRHALKRCHIERDRLADTFKRQGAID